MEGPGRNNQPLNPEALAAAKAKAVRAIEEDQAERTVEGTAQGKMSEQRQAKLERRSGGGTFDSATFADNIAKLGLTIEQAYNNIKLHKEEGRRDGCYRLKGEILGRDGKAHQIDIACEEEQIDFGSGPQTRIKAALDVVGDKFLYDNEEIDYTLANEIIDIYGPIVNGMLEAGSVDQGLERAHEEESKQAQYKINSKAYDVREEAKDKRIEEIRSAIL